MPTWAKGIVEPPASGEPPSDHGHGEPPADADLIRIAPVQEFSWNAGGQIDYETRRIYASLKTDLHESTAFTHRADTLQFGFAPYEHDVDSLATWLVVSGRRYSGNMHEGTEVALLLRFFKKADLDRGRRDHGRQTPVHGDVQFLSGERKIMRRKIGIAAVFLMVQLRRERNDHRNEGLRDGVRLLCPGHRKDAAKESCHGQRFVDLENKLVVVTTRDGQDISDAELTKAIADAGYDVKRISRTERSLDDIRGETLRAAAK